MEKILYELAAYPGWTHEMMIEHLCRFISQEGLTLQATVYLANAAKQPVPVVDEG